MATLPFSQFADDLPQILRDSRFHLGIGRGRYVGYDGPNENLNTDIFSDEYHPESAIGVFGGLDINFGDFADTLIKDITLAIEFDSRDLNAGIKATIGNFQAAIMAHKIEGWVEEEQGFHFGRIGFGIGYGFSLGKEKERPAPIWEPPPREPVAPEPTPTPEPETEPEPPALPILPPVSATLSLNTIYFDYDRSDVRPDQRERIAENARTLESNPDINVVIEGHCDERGTNEYNMALGQRRANSVLRYLINYGIDPDRLSTVSYGEERPVDYGHDESAWWKNRRAEFVQQP
jgi:peptidoglycan-associated lipoprotein